MEKNQEQPQIHATMNVPENSDLRGFSYRGPASEDHPENNEHFELKAEGNGKASAETENLSMAQGEAADLNPDDLEENNDLGAGPGADSSGLAGSAEEQDDNDDVLEEVRGGLRADAPEEIEYDDSDANARRKVS